MVFVRSVSEAAFASNLLRLIRQDRLDIDGSAAHLQGAAPPDKHRESARFMEPLLFLEQLGCTVLSVDLLSKSGHQGKPRGRTRSSFKRCWVPVRRHMHRRPIFPVLSGLPVLMAEQTFAKSLPHAVFSSLFFLRYVGNRLILAPSLPPWFLQRDTV